ncbi:hypothetical protein E3O55_06155 [Cryobacterium sp. MDB1-18-2]|uniref:hypothetical protein n=1 Tax=unclassified Cryobacterium TaxID=2649013 RepID=UPI00106CBC0F|nr:MULTISPECIES: hypothetical protein [unclassified Cryobacterium]TFC32188.1 hypothetical protein E3O55_06155 [Cryobacterium sp. MDB1-18-2]TFC37194.1 hypothetical protein E3O50_18270 [Cryobacterium sp. MDB1-18-1]
MNKPVHDLEVRLSSGVVGANTTGVHKFVEVLLDHFARHVVLKTPEVALHNSRIEDIASIVISK